MKKYKVLFCVSCGIIVLMTIVIGMLAHDLSKKNPWAIPSESVFRVFISGITTNVGDEKTTIELYDYNISESDDKKYINFKLYITSSSYEFKYENFTLTNGETTLVVNSEKSASVAEEKNNTNVDGILIESSGMVYISFEIPSDFNYGYDLKIANFGTFDSNCITAEPNYISETVY